MSFCGLRKPRPLRRRQLSQHEEKGKGRALLQEPDESTPPYPSRPDVSASFEVPRTSLSHESKPQYQFQSGTERKNLLAKRPTSANYQWASQDHWARDDQLSTITEQFDEQSRRSNTPNWEQEVGTAPEFAEPPIPPRAKREGKKTRFVEHVDCIYEDDENYETWKGKEIIRYTEEEIYGPPPDSRRSQESTASRRKYYKPRSHESVSYMSDRRSPETPRSIATPPRDLESIARIDKSLIFEHFTTNDAWELGSALRNRLLPVPTPVVINISLANQNQVLFHTCTHPGVMPDNDSWVKRKRNTVLRWGVSTWYMHCKFGGDEFAFRDKYGLGNDAGQYAIHGGGVPIRVTGVEGVVAVVVVSGLKQDEDHGVIVEVIRDLYY